MVSEQLEQYLRFHVFKCFLFPYLTGGGQAKCAIQRTFPSTFKRRTTKMASFRCVSSERESSRGSRPIGTFLHRVSVSIKYNLVTVVFQSVSIPRWR